MHVAYADKNMQISLTVREAIMRNEKFVVCLALSAKLLIFDSFQIYFNAACYILSSINVYDRIAYIV